MDGRVGTRCTAFAGDRRVAMGDLADVALRAKEVLDRGEPGPILVFDDATGEPIEVDFRGTAEDVAGRLAQRIESASDALTTSGMGAASRGPGRPRLGVVAREVTLLPRHWEWLSEQPGGASVALRKLVEAARRANEGKDRVRRAQEAAYRFLSIMGGNLPGFEEVLRALFAGNRTRFEEFVEPWPADVRDHAKLLAEAAFPEETGSTLGHSYP